METFTVLTTQANVALRPLHHRMPVVLQPEAFDAWLSGGAFAVDPAPDDPLYALRVGIRVTAEQWTRIEEVARERQVSPNQLVVELAIEALDRREWPGTETEIKVARASLFTAQVLARDLIDKGREQEVRDIRDFISTIVPDPDAAPPTEAPAARQSSSSEGNDSG